MLRVGLTGNIGSGKSTVAAIFSALGVPVYHTDDESKKFLLQEPVLREVASLFGQSILSESGMIKRRALASIVFNDEAAMQALNAILHPFVKQDARKWNERHAECPYVIHEAAIIFECGFRPEYDRVIYVTCPQETAILRVMNRDGASREEVLRRLRFQWEDEKKTGLCDDILRNDGTVFLIPQVMEVHERLMNIGR